MGFTRRKPTVRIWFTAVILIVLAVLMMILTTNKKVALPDNWLFTVDGYAVTDEEYLFYINEQRAVTVNYFYRGYRQQNAENVR
ncbi:hypothetical protein [Paenibacillus alvei]|uniref:hypothetical protein n=1 Tax=Paenibacillus alvei TaxID=44250 RepID=UPI0013DB64E4|nr:hypothetical protein [Paenibacillus alvei]NEZ42866.1 hypothetical protein [Paenibacillus alvei]